jgi:putative phosphoribosyl transferase
VFQDRLHAGAALAEALVDLRRRANLTVVGIARGGVPVAAEVARVLDLPFDMLCVRKVAVPGYPDLAMGAVATMGERYTNRRIASTLPAPVFDDVFDRTAADVRAMDERLRGGLPLNVIARNALLVDEGAATGASIRAALAAVRNAGARTATVALPVAPGPTAERLSRECHRLVVLDTPRTFHAIREHYERFDPVDEPQLRALYVAAGGPVEATA